MAKICLFTSVFYNNIGNAFIDIGAEETIKAAMGNDDDLVKISQCPFFATSMGKGMQLREAKAVRWIWRAVMSKYAGKLHDRSYSMISSHTVFNLLDIVELDYLIIPGCVLTVPFFTIFGDVLRRCSKRGVKIIFLGASGNFYTDYEISYVRKQIESIQPVALMTRDSVAWKLYENSVSNVYNGIDNAFFVNRSDIKSIKTCKDPYVVLSFDNESHKQIQIFLERQFDKRNIIYTDHKPYSYSNIKKKVDKGYVCSDYPLDYLLIYKNAEEVYSDRVHACIPTLSFGNKCRLYSESKRIALFENVGAADITSKLICLEGLSERQDSQIKYLSNLLTL